MEEACPGNIGAGADEKVWGSGELGGSIRAIVCGQIKFQKGKRRREGDKKAGALLVGLCNFNGRDICDFDQIDFDLI